MYNIALAIVRIHLKCEKFLITNPIEVSRCQRLMAWVLFQFPVHGIFREYGVGRGAPRSMGNSVRRSMSDWFSGALNRKENKMLDIVAEHQGDKVVRTFMGIKK